ncbi:MAG: bifunctional precorrin-2 dehydrogenase/sirohydrochlorin ferrochelatase [Bacteroidota bacterium]
MNELYPIFLKARRLKFLIVGGGAVGEEKLHNLLRSSPQATVLLVAPTIRKGILSLAVKHPAVELQHEPFVESHLEGIDIAILATEKQEVNLKIRELARARGILTNVADSPDLCDFYMCSIVTKGDLKIGISTNGKSPTFAKRFRQLLEATLPDSIPDLLNNLRSIRDRLSGDFTQKVEKLNAITQNMVADEKMEDRTKK